MSDEIRRVVPNLRDESVEAGEPMPGTPGTGAGWRGLDAGARPWWPSQQPQSQRKVTVIGMEGTSTDPSGVVHVGKSEAMVARVEADALVLEGAEHIIVIGWGVVDGIRLAMPVRDQMLRGPSRWRRFRRWLGGV